MLDKDPHSLPAKIRQLLETTNIGYLSVASPKGDLFSYPVAFYFSGSDIYFVTPVSSAKLRFIRANRRVSLIVDNRKLTLDAVGALIQGDARILTIGQLFTSVLSVLPSALGFSKKYPGMFSFYAKGKDLPDERKLHKYRLIRIAPASMLYWIGYKYERFVPRKGHAKQLGERKSDRKIVSPTPRAVASLLEYRSEQTELEPPLSFDESWLLKLEEAASEGVVSPEERRIISLFADNSSKSSGKLTKTPLDPRVSIDEKSILKRWLASNETQKRPS